jgi:hypothetical protein
VKLTDRHDASHEDLLQSVVCGDIPHGDPRLAEAQACPTCQRELAEHEQLAELLDGWGAEQRRAQQAAAGGSPAHGSALVEPFIRQRLAESRPPARSPVWVPLAAAAALAVTTTAAWVVTERQGSDQRGGDTLLGEGDLELRASRTPDGLPSVTWSAGLPQGGRYELRLFPTDGAGRELAVLHTTEPRWTPSPTERAALPAAFELEVTVLDAQGVAVRQGSLELSR